MPANFMNSVQMRKPTRNVFDLTHDVKMSGKMGILYPVLAAEAVPGDTFHLGCNLFMRFAPILAPIMHRVDVYVDYFAVPNRIVWDGWEDFIVGAPGAGALPYLVLEEAVPEAQRKFFDYFGINPQVPVGFGGSINLNALPFAAYQKIYNEYYRDENLCPEIDFELVAGNNAAQYTELATLRNRAWEKDYFTASLPFAQKGGAVDIPLGRVELDPDWYTGVDATNPIFRQTDGTVAASDAQILNLGVFDPGNPYIATSADQSEPLAYDPMDSLLVQPTTINDLRTAMRLQEWLERNMRGGTRYIEFNLAHFGVRSSDKRLQRPEFIARVKAPVVISEVLNQAGPDTGSPQGDMAGHGISVANGKAGKYFFEEHGYVIGILSVIPKTAYQDGVPKHFLKNDFMDFMFPSFAHLGEQPVVNAEVYAYGPLPTETFGYMPRYSEYRTILSRTAGDFRTTLDYWTLTRKFASMPVLNQEFVEVTPEDVERIFAVQDDTDNLWMHLLHNIKAVRPLPRFGTPSL